MLGARCWLLSLAAARAASHPSVRILRRRFPPPPPLDVTATPDAILVFVRAPETGRVKTRLAAEIGAEAALRVYRRLAEHAVAEARALGADVALRIHYTPAEGGEAVRAWLG